MRRKLFKLNLWLHAGLAVAGVILLFAVQFPLSMNGLTWLYSFGFVMIWGIGDGHPSQESKIFGGIVLAVATIVVLSTLILNVSLFIRLLLLKTRSWRFKTSFLSGVLIALAFSFFMAWRGSCEELASDAIMAGDVQTYERAARWRYKGNINDDLFCAARWGQLRVVEYLVSKGADPNAKPEGGDSILSGAIPNVLNKPDGNLPVVEYLRNHRATN